MIIKSATDFVERVLQIWPPFRWDEVQEQAWAELMVRELCGFKPEVLERGFQELVRKRKESRTPTPAECISACAEAKRWLEMEANDGKLPGFREPSRGDYSKEREGFALTMLKSPLGKEAARDGWVLAAFNFATREGRLPDSRRYEPRNQKEREEYAGCTEIEFCKRSARDLDESYRVALRGEVVDANGKVKPMAFAAALQKLGASMLAKREKLSAEVLGR
jgi:hypothetical protein